MMAFLLVFLVGGWMVNEGKLRPGKMQPAEMCAPNTRLPELSASVNPSTLLGFTPLAVVELMVDTSA